jgi:hypothetical protein
MGLALLVPSPLLGPPSWEPVAAELRSSGAPAEVARLTPPLDAVHPWWSHAAREVAAAAGTGREVVLIGHSGAGPRLAVFGAAITEHGARVTGYLFVDAGLPSPGQSVLAQSPPEAVALIDRLTGDDGLLPPWCEWWDEGFLDALVPDPVARHHLESACWPVPRSLFDEVTPVPDRWPDAPCGYLRLSEAYDDEAAAAEASGWPCRRWDGSHLDPVTRPADVAAELMELADAAGCPLR